MSNEDPPYNYAGMYAFNNGWQIVDRLNDEQAKEHLERLGYELPNQDLHHPYGLYGFYNKGYILVDENLALYRADFQWYLIEPPENWTPPLPH